jgi:hypothetical protein
MVSDLFMSFSEQEQKGKYRGRKRHRKNTAIVSYD